MRAGKHRRTKHVGDDLCDGAVARRAAGSDDAFGRRKPDAGEVGTRQGCHAAWSDVTIYQPAGRRTLRHAIAWTGTALPTLHEPPPTTPPHVTSSTTCHVKHHTASHCTTGTGTPTHLGRHLRHRFTCRSEQVRAGGWEVWSDLGLGTQPHMPLSSSLHARRPYNPSQVRTWVTKKPTYPLFPGVDLLTRSAIPSQVPPHTRSRTASRVKDPFL